MTSSRASASHGRDFGSRAETGVVRLFGVHPVEAALRNPRRGIARLLVTDNARRRLAEVIAGRAIEAESVTPRDLDRLLGPEAVHQGALLETTPLPEPDLADMIASAAAAGPIVVLDQVTDPHNVGAVLRSAAVFGASGLILSRRHSPPLDGVLAKAASGALELVAVVLVQNLARALAELKDAHVLVLGLDGGAENALEQESFAGAAAVVLGAEGKGLRQLTRATCDRLVRIGGAGPLSSLNVSNAAAVALHTAALRRSAAPAA